MLIEIPRHPKAERNLMRLTIPAILAARTVFEFQNFEPESVEPNEAIALEPATEYDIEQRRTYQIERYLELEKTNSLTLQWKKYAERNADDISYYLESKSKNHFLRASIPGSVPFSINSSIAPPPVEI